MLWGVWIRFIMKTQTKITKNLINSEFFYPEAYGIEKFGFHKYCDDYSSYEFDFIENASGAIGSVYEIISTIGVKKKARTIDQIKIPAIK